MLTVYNQQRRNELRKEYEGKRRIPKTLRPKLTRALRREMTDEQKAKVVPRIAKRLANFPRRKYALKA